MREFVKVVSALVFVAACLAATLAWLTDRPDTVMWYLRIGGPIVAIPAIVIFLKIHFQADKVPDYLRELVGNYFNRGGFCFAFGAISIDGVCHFDAYFQNQHDRPCRGRIALRPARGFFLGRANIETITFEIDCGPAAFGVARIAIPLLKELQGKSQSFEVGASVVFPQGKGGMLRCHDGIVLRRNSNFGNAFGTALTFVGAMGGSIILSTPATVSIDMPVGVAEGISEDLKPEIRTIWELGDPPLDDGD